MFSKMKLAPVVFILTVACGESTAFKESELGRFEITVAAGNDPTFPYADGTVPLEQSLGAPGAETRSVSAAGTNAQAPVSNQAKIQATLAETDRSSDSVESGTEVEKGGKTQGQAEKGAAGNPSGNSSEISDEQTMKLCSTLFEGKAKYMRLIRSTDATSAIHANSETVIAVRLSGNQVKFALNVGGSEKLAGLCIVATGNMPSTEISSSVAMGQIVYVARGNQSKATFDFHGATLDAAFVDLKGNKHHVGFGGVGADVCSSLDLNQSKSTVSCH